MERCWSIVQNASYGRDSACLVIYLIDDKHDGIDSNISTKHQNMICLSRMYRLDCEKAG